MKQLLAFISIILLSSCSVFGPRSDELTAAQNAVIDTLQEITADGLVTLEEQARLDVAMQAYFTAQEATTGSFDWATFLASVGAALGPGGVLLWSLINGYRNSREKNLGQPLRAPPEGSKDPVVVKASAAETLVA